MLAGSSVMGGGVVAMYATARLTPVDLEQRSAIIDSTTLFFSRDGGRDGATHCQGLRR